MTQKKPGNLRPAEAAAAASETAAVVASAVAAAASEAAAVQAMLSSAEIELHTDSKATEER